MPQFSTAAADSLSEITKLLASAGLCHDDLKPEYMEHFLILSEEDELTGAIGLEVFGEDALLRSLIVSPDHRRKGLGIRLVEGIETHARNTGVRSLFLLTTTADRFFEQRGYDRIDRSSVPDEIGKTTEFVSFCPDSAVCMRKDLS